MEAMESHFYNWFGVGFFIFIYGLIVFMIPFYRKMDRKPKGAFLAFVIAFAIEMHGIPFSMYIISWVVGKNLPEGILWGHTLFGSIGYLGMYINISCAIVAFFIIFSGWKSIYKYYWSKESGKGRVVTTGIYRFIRHPQYTGLLLLSLGMLIEWATLPLLIMFPIMINMYIRLAKKEEEYMIKEFGDDYIKYMEKTKRLIPFVY